MIQILKLREPYPIYKNVLKSLTVSLVNERGETVAVRDARIKRNDQCFCVWYCNCVCLSKFYNIEYNEIVTYLKCQ